MTPLRLVVTRFLLLFGTHSVVVIWYKASIFLGAIVEVAESHLVLGTANLSGSITWQSGQTGCCYGYFDFFFRPNGLELGYFESVNKSKGLPI
jgi:hypothetical protein